MKQQNRPRHRCAVCCALLLCLLAPWVQATPLGLDPAGSGEVSFDARYPVIPPSWPPGIPIPEPVIRYRHDRPLDGIAIESYSSAGCLCSVYYHNHGYLIYDVPDLASGVIGADLQFSLNISGDADNLTLYTVDGFSPEFLDALPGGGIGGLPAALGEALFTDLSQGTVLGATDISGGTGVYTATLNATALELINSTGGRLVFGVAHPSLSSEGFLEIAFRAAPRLLLDESAHAVPVPGTLWLLLVAGPLLLPGRWRCS